MTNATSLSFRIVGLAIIASLAFGGLSANAASEHKQRENDRAPRVQNHVSDRVTDRHDQKEKDDHKQTKDDQGNHKSHSPHKTREERCKQDIKHPNRGAGNCDNDQNDRDGKDRKDTRDKDPRKCRERKLPLLRKHSDCKETTSVTDSNDHKEAGIRVGISDGRDLTRPGHTVTYTTIVENTGDLDMHDVRVTNEVPQELAVTSISNGGTLDGRTITWNNLSVDAQGKKAVSFTATVKTSTKNNTVLDAHATAKSEDHDVSDNDSDSTTVEVAKQAQVAGTQRAVSVPVTATTGSTAMVSILSALSGGSGLLYLLRRGI